MAGGLAALLDDVAALARLAAANADDIAAASMKASAKAAGVVVDDAAVTPQYVQGVKPNRELPIIWKIAKGSLVNKAIIIVFALLLSQFVPWLLTPLLMLGGTYLCFEGAHKIWELVRGAKKDDTEPALVQGPDAEKRVVSGAVRTDFILSAEIMVISLNEVASEPLVNRALILVVVAVLITAVVYGAVGLLVKMDDIGLAMTKKGSPRSQRFGYALVQAMPTVMTVISYVGMFAMLWVGGHIMLVGADELGFHAPYALVHALEDPIHHVATVGPLLAWCVNTLCSLILGLIWGTLIMGAWSLTPWGKHH
ncbi:MAG: DUF808 domain-containing protein [Dermabacter sp.]|nr:DUF808 domain-containing protein [Dermabacter sp.]